MTRAHLTVIVVLVFVIGAVVAVLLPPVLLIHLANVMTVILATATLIAFRPSLIEVFKTKGILPSGHILAFGICMLSLGMIVRQGGQYLAGPLHVSDAGPVVETTMTDLAFWIWAVGRFIMLSGVAVSLIAVVHVSPREEKDK